MFQENVWDPHGNHLFQGVALQAAVDYSQLVNLFKFWQKYSGPEIEVDNLGTYFNHSMENRLISALFGFQHLHGAKYLAPKADLILNPSKAHDTDEFYSLPSMIMNPFAPAATELAIAGNKLKDKHDDNKGYKVASAFLWIPRGGIAALALVVNFLETMITYAIVATLAIISTPVLVPLLIASRVRAKRAENQDYVHALHLHGAAANFGQDQDSSGHGFDYHQMGGGDGNNQEWQNTHYVDGEGDVNSYAPL